jgi:hypothetical protein
MSSSATVPTRGCRSPSEDCCDAPRLSYEARRREIRQELLFAVAGIADLVNLEGDEDDDAPRCIECERSAVPVRAAAWVNGRCPVCLQEKGRHWSVPHAWMPAEEQARRRWFSEEEAEAWLRRQLAGLNNKEGGA